MKIFVEICVLEPKDAFKVVEALIGDGCCAVIRGNAYDQVNPTIFVLGYGEREHGGYEDVDEYFDELIGEIGGDVTESGEGHQDTMGEVVPPADGQMFSIDVLDDQSGIAHRISCAAYSPERGYAMAIEAAGLLANVRPGSLGNCLARRMLAMALGSSAGKSSETDVDFRAALKKAQAEEAA